MLLTRCMQGLEIIHRQRFGQGDRDAIRLGMTKKIRRDKWNEQMAISNVVQQGQEQLVKDVFNT